MCSSICAQEKIMIDQVVAVIGNKMIKHSDIESQLNNMRAQGETIDGTTYCKVLEQLMISKVYEHQAELDSIEIPENEVEAELDLRIRFFTEQIGSKEKLEEFYGKSILAIKEEFRDMVQAQMVSGRMESKITEEVKVTPSEVRKYFSLLNSDSLPLIPTEYEVFQIIKKPVVNQEQKDLIKTRLNEYRSRILKGERFSSLAVMFSEDPGSAQKGGETGFFGRGEMVSEFESTAFSLKEGEISPVIETPFGFHILQLIERRGENVNVRHILLRPEANIEDLNRAQIFLDSVAKLIRDSVYSFQKAAELFSDDPSGKMGGLYTGQKSGNARMMAEDMESDVFFLINMFKIGDISNATFYETKDREKAVRIVMLANRTAPHSANLENDYDKIYNMAMQQARQKTMTDWLSQKLKTLYVRLNTKTKECQFEYQWGQ